MVENYFIIHNSVFKIFNNEARWLYVELIKLHILFHAQSGDCFKNPAT